MNQLLILVGHYLRYHRCKTMLLMLSMILTLYLPCTVYRLVTQYQSRLMLRAEATPIVIGPKASRFDLIFHTLYFRRMAPSGLSMETVEEIRHSGLAQAIPFHGMFSARESAIIGTDIDYFSFRHLSLAQGEFFLTLGDCVLGAKVAQKLDLGPGDSLMSDPANVFDIAGEYPLDMRICGILKKSDTPDDDAVFVDVKTAWVIQGLGHGHQDVTRLEDDGVILKKEEGRVVAGAALMHYMEITPEIIDSFHFHGDPSRFPLTGLICIPNDAKSAAILAGRYQNHLTLQLLEPTKVVRELFRFIFKIKRFFDVNVWLISISTTLLLILVVLLSQRLRRREMATMFCLGCSRGMIWKLQACELGVIFSVSLALALMAMQITMAYAPYWMKFLLAIGN